MSRSKKEFLKSTSRKRTQRKRKQRSQSGFLKNNTSRKRKQKSLVPITSRHFGFTYTLKRDTLLYTGTRHGTVSFPLYLTPHKGLARMYAGGDGYVLSYRTTRPLRLLEKCDVLWGVNRGKVPREEWVGFGSRGGDAPVAKALCRRALDERSWVYRFDGWIHKYSSHTQAEVLVCDAGALTPTT